MLFYFNFGIFVWLLFVALYILVYVWYCVYYLCIAVLFSIIGILMHFLLCMYFLRYIYMCVHIAFCVLILVVFCIMVGICGIFSYKLHVLCILLCVLNILGCGVFVVVLFSIFYYLLYMAQCHCYRVYLILVVVLMVIEKYFVLLLDSIVRFWHA